MDQQVIRRAVVNDPLKEIGQEELTKKQTNQGLLYQLRMALRLIIELILWLEPLWLALLTPSLLLRDLFWEEWLHPWLIGGLFLFWPLRLLVKHHLAPHTPLNLPIYGLLLLLPFGLWDLYDQAQGWNAAGFLTLGIALYFAFLNWQTTQRRPWLLVWMIGVCGFLLSMLGPELLQRVPQEFFWFSEEVARSKPIDPFGWGETLNPNVLAGNLLLPIPLVFALAMRTSWAKRRWLPPFLLLFVLPMLLTLSLAQSRGSYLAIFVALLCVISLRWPWAGLAIGVAVISVVTVVVMSGTALFLGTFGSDGSVTSLSGRVEIWQQSLTTLATYPLTGLGLGQFGPMWPLFGVGEWGGSQIAHAHNLFLQISMDLGIPGLLCYLWLLAVTIRALIKIILHDGYIEDDSQIKQNTLIYSRQVNSQQRAKARRARVYDRRNASLRWCLAVGTLAALVGLLVHGTVDAVTWGTKLSFLPWLLFALTALLVYQEKVGQH